MDPTVLAWALAQPAGTRAAVLAAAFTGGTTRVTFDGRSTHSEVSGGLLILPGGPGEILRA